MKNKMEIQRYFKNQYYNKDSNYKAILSEIIKDEKMYQKSIFKMVAAIIITFIGMTSIVVAGVNVYDEYIKKKGETDTEEFFITETGRFSTDFSNDMIFVKETGLYYKIITNMMDYSSYKIKLQELPEMTEEDFKENFLIILANWGTRQPDESDLTISEIKADERTTYVTLRQKEKPNYDKTSMIIYAECHKSLLREKIEISIEKSNLQNPNFVNLESLPNDYSIEEALKDGCFVEENNRVLSKDKYAIDELIENSKKGVESCVRIYSKFNNYVRIIDLEFKNGIFIANGFTSENKNIYTKSFRYLTKSYYKNDIYTYGYNDIDSSDGAGILLEIYLD